VSWCAGLEWERERKGVKMPIGHKTRCRDSRKSELLGRETRPLLLRREAAQPRLAPG